MTTPDEDRVPGVRLDPESRDPEAPPEDAVEQARMADPGQDEDRESRRGLDVSTREVSEWDALEQATVVQLDDDDR